MDEALINKENVRILLANDDGIDALGLKILEKVANTLSSEVWIVAPVKEQSATGHSLTLRRPRTEAICGKWPPHRLCFTSR